MIMKVKEYITRMRIKYSLDLIGKEAYWSLSALTFCGKKIIKQVIAKNVNGTTLDAGAGHLNYKTILSKYSSKYSSFDVQNFDGNIDITGDIQNMVGIPDCSYDTVCCFHVFEHIPMPGKAVSEIYRILKSGGTFIVSVPLFAGLHEEPYDFYRYTPYGIRFLLEQSEFVIKEEYRLGGLLSFITHPFSMVIVCLLWKIPVIKWIIWILNKLLVIYPVVFLDRILKLDSKFPASILMVARKEEG
jgi:SAM-dependent methyltransferase